MVTNAQVASVPGWFTRIDVQAFRTLLEATAQHFPAGGDLAELGVYLGKSAVLVGGYVRVGETFTVIDLFEDPARDEANTQENDDQYPDLTRASFERHYLKVHDQLPVVITGPSQSITQHASEGTHRFVHIDASHLYDHVVGDIAAARRLLMADGIVVLDDYRSPHTPGVACAAWETSDLKPFLLTESKLYATWGDARPWNEAVAEWVRGFTSDRSELQQIRGQEVTRVWATSPKVAQFIPPVAMPALRRLRARVGK